MGFARLLGCLAVFGQAAHGTYGYCTTDSVPGYAKLGSNGICTGQPQPRTGCNYSADKFVFFPGHDHIFLHGQRFDIRNRLLD